MSQTGQVFGKVWGTTATIFANNNVQINRIVGKKGSHCSKHKHNHKFNLFFVEKGSLAVEVWKSDYALVDTAILTPQQSMIVKPG
jgi:quercetin dioxygenase-like cupin family protein